MYNNFVAVRTVGAVLIKKPRRSMSGRPETKRRRRQVAACPSDRDEKLCEGADGVSGGFETAGPYAHKGLVGKYRIKNRGESRGNFGIVPRRDYFFGRKKAVPAQRGAHANGRNVLCFFCFMRNIFAPSLFQCPRPV